MATTRFADCVPGVSPSPLSRRKLVVAGELLQKPTASVMISSGKNKPSSLVPV